MTELHFQDFTCTGKGKLSQVLFKCLEWIKFFTNIIVKKDRSLKNLPTLYLIKLIQAKYPSLMHVFTNLLFNLVFRNSTIYLVALDATKILH